MTVEPVARPAATGPVEKPEQETCGLRGQLIEAAARALVEQAALTQPWDSMPDYLRDGYRRAAASAVEAALPLLADGVERAAEDFYSGEQYYVDGYVDGRDHAVALVRSLGPRQCSTGGNGWLFKHHSLDGREMHEPSVAAVMTTCVDQERYAEIFNRGYETAVSQGMVDDPERAEEWLESRYALAAASALREAADKVDAHRGAGNDFRDAVISQCANLLRGLADEAEEGK